MAIAPTVCPNCRTWFEGRGRNPRCPSCGARAGKHQPAVAWPTTASPDATPGPTRAPEASSTPYAAAPRWAAYLGAMMLLVLGAGLFYAGVSSESFLLLALGAVLIGLVTWSAKASAAWQRFPESPLHIALLVRVPGYLGYAFALLAAFVAQCATS